MSSDKKNIMIVEDDNSVRSIMKNMLGDTCNIVGETDDGKKAVTMFNELKPDVALIDIELPNKNGIQILREIMEENADARVIIYSGIAHLSLINQVYEMGAKEFLQKPFKAEDLLEAVKKALAS